MSDYMPASLSPGRAAKPAVPVDHVRLPGADDEQISALSTLVCERGLTSQQLGTISALLDFVGRSVCAGHRAADDYLEVWGPARRMYLSLVDSLEVPR